MTIARTSPTPEAPTPEAAVVANAVPEDAGDLSAGRIDRDAIARGVELILAGIGEDTRRPGLIDTPQRVADSLAGLVAGYGTDPASVLEALPDERSNGLIMVRAIPIASLCQHHLLPFVGTAAIAYLPGPAGTITGLSRLTQLMFVLSRRLQVQERLVREAADAVESALDPAGVFVLLEAKHSCVSLRDPAKRGTIAVTTETRGVFANDPATRAELVALARG